MWQLLTHSSGLGNPLPVKWVHAAGSPGPDQEEMLRKLMARRRPFSDRVGGTGHYSNVGYLAAAQIISTVAGEPFQSYVQREILTRLGMAATAFSSLPGHQAATGHVRIPRPLTPLLAGVLQESTARAMSDIHVKGKRFDHAAGWFRKHTNGPQGSYVEHFGTGLGFWNIMRLYPERGTGMVIMSNSTSSYDYAALFSLILRMPWI